MIEASMVFKNIKLQNYSLSCEKAGSNYFVNVKLFAYYDIDETI